MKHFILFPVLFLNGLVASAQVNNKMKLIDSKATKETKALYSNLSALSKHHILFGQQHATEYGHDGRATAVLIEAM